MSVPLVYAIGDAIQARLVAELPTLYPTATVPVLRAATIETLPKNVPLAVVVVPAGLEIDEQRRNQVAVAEAVAVVVQVRNPSAQLTGTAAMNEAGPLLSACIRALLGWTPDGDAYEPLSMIAAPGPEFGAGFGFYPIAFQTRYVLSGA